MYDLDKNEVMTERETAIIKLLVIDNRTVNVATLSDTKASASRKFKTTPLSTNVNIPEELHIFVHDTLITNLPMVSTNKSNHSEGILEHSSLVSLFDEFLIC